MQHHVGRTPDGVWAADISANSDTDVASQNSLEDRYQALEPGAKIDTAQFMVIDEAELTPTPGDEDYADPQLPHPVLPDLTAGRDRQSWVDLMDETPHSTPQAPKASSSGDPPGKAEAKLEAKDNPVVSSSGALPAPGITKLQAFEEYVLRLPYMQEGCWKMECPAEVTHDMHSDHTAGAYARQQKARDKSIEEWDNILSLQEIPREARRYLDETHKQYGGFLENPYYYPEEPSEQKPMYAYPGKDTLLGRAPEFPVRGRNGELITMLPNRFIDPANVVELMDYAVPVIDYKIQTFSGSIWNSSSWGIPGHTNGADLRPEDYVEISRSDQGRALLGESMGPDCWLGTRTGATHEPSDSGKYNEKQEHLLRLFQKRLDLTHVPGAESAGILGAKALLPLGLGTINPFLIAMVMQNTPVAHLFQLQFQSNCVMRGSRRLQTIFIWVQLPVKSEQIFCKFFEKYLYQITSAR